jgi:hypothetical protein
MYLPILVQHVAQLGVCLLKLTSNGEIINHPKEDNKFCIESAEIHAWGMCRVLEVKSKNNTMGSN